MLYQIYCKARALISAHVKKDSWLFVVFASMGRFMSRIIGEGPDLTYEIVSRFASLCPDVYFIQVGSNDGITGDPIHKFVIRDRWNGILIEPVPYVYQRLLQNYRGHTGVIFENCAISETETVRDFWYLQETEADLPPTYDQLGSFFLEVILEHKENIPDIEKYIVKTQVNCTTLERLVQKYRVNRVDLFHIDTEGYDFEILRQFDFSKYTPIIVIYEHNHLSKEARRAARMILEGYSYRLFEGETDIIAVKKDWVSRLGMGRKYDL